MTRSAYTHEKPRRVVYGDGAFFDPVCEKCGRTHMIVEVCNQAGIRVWEKNSLLPLLNRPLRQEFP